MFERIPTKPYWVRPGLVVRLSESKTYTSNEQIELTEFEYANHAHQLEDEDQYKTRLALLNPKAKSSK